MINRAALLHELTFSMKGFQRQMMSQTSKKRGFFQNSTSETFAMTGFISATMQFLIITRSVNFRDTDSFNNVVNAIEKR